MVARNEVGITLTAKDLASREIGRVGGSLENLSGTAETTGGRLGKLGSIAGGVFNGILLGAGMYAFQAMRTGFGFVKDSVIGFNSQMQGAGMAFETMLGSGKKAQAFLNDLRTFAAKTPFEFPELVTASQRMLAYGFSAKQIIPTLTAVGDAAAGLGGTPEMIDRITTAIGQMKAKGKVSGEEMRQLAEAGVPAWDILAKGVGHTTAETMKLVEKGVIPAGAAVDILTKGMETRFHNLMDKQSHTFSGAMSTIKDVTRDVMSTAFRPFFDLIASGADKLSTFLQNAPVDEWAQNFADGLQKAIDGAKSLFEWAGNVFEVLRSGDDIASGLDEMWGNLFERFQGLSNIHIDFDAIARQALAMKVKVQDALLRIWDALVAGLPGAINSLTAALPGVLTTVLHAIATYVPQWLEATMQFISGLVNTLYEHRGEIITAVSNFFQAAFDWLINTGIPMAAQAVAAFIPVFIDWVFDMLPKLLDMLDDVIGAIINFIITNAPVLAGKLIEWAIAFVGFIATEVVPRLIKNLPTILRVILLFIGTAAVKLLGKMAELGGGMVSRFISFLGELPHKAAYKFGELIGRVILWARDLLGKGGDAAKNFVLRVVQFFSELPGKVWKWLSDIVGQIGRWGTNLLHKAASSAGDFVRGFINGLASLPGKIADAIRSAFSHLHIDIGPFHISGSGVTIDLPNIKVPSFAVGAWKLPTDMLAQVHKGEMIVPADLAARLRGESSGASALAVSASASGGGSTVRLEINNYYGPSSVRSSEDIRRISEAQAERVRLLGVPFTARTTGSVGP
jgi:tape measure domain-containing protein